MSKQRNREEKIPVVPLYSGPVKVLAIPPFGASSNNGLWRAKDKPPVELVVANLGTGHDWTTLPTVFVLYYQKMKLVFVKIDKSGCNLRMKIDSLRIK